MDDGTEIERANSTRKLLATTEEQQRLAARIQYDLAEYITDKLTEYREAGGLPVVGLKVDCSRNGRRVGVRILVTL